MLFKLFEYFAKIIKILVESQRFFKRNLVFHFLLLKSECCTISDVSKFRADDKNWSEDKTANLLRLTSYFLSKVRKVFDFYIAFQTSDVIFHLLERCRCGHKNWKMIDYSWSLVMHNKSKRISFVSILF